MKKKKKHRVNIRVDEGEREAWETRSVSFGLWSGLSEAIRQCVSIGLDPDDYGNRLPPTEADGVEPMIVEETGKEAVVCVRLSSDEKRRWRLGKMELGLTSMSSMVIKLMRQVLVLR